MKKITLLFSVLIACSYNAFSQCDVPLPLPYLADAESATVPELPQCMYSGPMTFISLETFETIAGPIEGFSGNVFAYSTTVQEGAQENWGVGTTLGSGPLEFNQETSYTVSYKYGMSIPGGTIASIRTMLIYGGEYITLSEQENVVVNNPISFVTEPFSVEESGSYYLYMEFQMTGTQGLVYLDDIAIEEVPAASVKENTLNSLTVYPNPVKNEINLANADDIDSVILYNVAGQKVLSQQVSGSDAKINTEALSKGIYFLKTTSGTAQKTIKVIKD